MRGDRRSLTRHGAEIVAGVIDYPADAFYDIPSLHITGECHMTVEGCSGIIGCSENEMCFDMGTFTLTVYGKDFLIESLSGAEMNVNGKIMTLAINRKAEPLCD